ncbi:MAG: 2-dehydropantoate 2-reductase [Candidatus Omnitrophica bacterium]|nr:2-dehydropantoate 2-reductase [Candidatus Omnitrophota bacterium]
MKIAVVGPGAMGCLLAAFLARAKCEVWMLDKDSARAGRISQSGISVEGVSGNWRAQVRATAEPKDIGNADLILICVKSYDTKSAITAAKTLAGEDTAVLTLQNGIGNIELISEVVGPEKVIGGITNMGATLLDTGRIRHAGKGETVLGRIDGKIPVEIRSIREVFNRAGLETRISRDIKGSIWSKLLINAGINPLTAITRLNNGRLLDFEGTRKIISLAVSEGTKVAKRKRIKLIYDDPLAKVEAVCQATAGNISSMLQDVLNKKPTEIDFINGVIVRQAQELGIPAPVNALLFDLVKTIESSYHLGAGGRGRKK